MDNKRTPAAKRRTLERKRVRKNKRVRACNGVPCVEGCPMVACKSVVRGWLVVSMVSDASFGPFTESEAKRFAARNQNYAAFRISDLRRDMYSRLKYAL